MQPGVSDYDPLHFMRCHFNGSRVHEDNDPTDDETVVWRCMFEPDPYDPSKFACVIKIKLRHSVGCDLIRMPSVPDTESEKREDH